MQPKQNMPMARKDENILEYYSTYKNEEYILDKQDIRRDDKDDILHSTKLVKKYV